MFWRKQNEGHLKILVAILEFLFLEVTNLRVHQTVADARFLTLRLVSFHYYIVIQAHLDLTSPGAKHGVYLV